MTLAELCVKRGVFAAMLIAFLVVLGVFSFRELGVDLFPRADPATVNINVRLPGATPEEMTTQVVLPLEEALSTISGLDEMTSQSTEGSARVTCDDKVFLLAENQSTYIPLGSRHRLENPGKVPLELIEVQSGSYLGEDDIVRFEDVYGRGG